MKTLKKVITILMIICITLSLCPVSVSAKSPKKEIQKQTQGLFKAAKKYDISKVKKYCAPGSSVLHIKDKHFQKYIKKGNKKYFDAEIKKISVKKDTATVTVRITNLSGWNIADNAISEYYRSLDFSTQNFENCIDSYYELALEDPTDDDVSSYTFKLKYKKINNKWLISKINSGFLEMLDGGFAERLDQFSKTAK